MSSRFVVFVIVSIALFSLFSLSVIANEGPSIGKFSNGDLFGWKEESFKGNSQYEIADVGGKQVLKASTKGMASGLFKEVNIDLNKTPWMNWSWQVSNIYSNNDERSKEGDDYVARVYVVVSGGLFFWNTKAINYVWSSHQAVGEGWPNAYTGNARMLAIRSGDQQLGQWLNEKRNVREDLKKIFGEDIDRIDAIAVMVDGDNTGQSATSYFGDIFFSEN